MARYPRPIRLPQEVGDSVDFNLVTCRFCGHSTTIAIERLVRGAQVQVVANVPICCDEVARRHHDIEEEIAQ